MRILLLTALAVTAMLVSLSGAKAADFNIASVNLLHLGQEGNTAEKCKRVESLMKNNDIILIQELMTPAPCSFSSKFRWQPFGPFGQSSYKEYFGFLYATPQAGHAASFAMMTTSPTLVPAGTFERPPAAALFWVQAPGKAYYLWVVNVHSIWGKYGVGPRQAEAQLAAAFGTTLRTTTAKVVGAPSSNQLTGNTRVIFAGDWNIETNYKTGQPSPGFAAFVSNGFSFAPNDQTSLTQPGGLSKRYDHFVYTNVVGAGLSVSPPNRFTCALNASPVVCQPWRGVISDHLGISAAVTAQ